MRPTAHTGRILGLVTIVMGLATGCAPEPAPTDEAPAALSEILHDGTVRVCTTGDYRPFTYRDGQGNWSGLDIEMAGDMARHFGVSLQFVPTTWKTLTTDLGNTCDMAMGGISINPDRAKRALFSDPYLHDGKAGIARCSDSGRFHGLDDIDQPGVRVIVNPGGGNAEFDRTHLRNATVVSWPDNNTIFGQVETGTADVMITDTSEIRWQTAVNSRLCGVALDHPFTFEQKAYLFPKTSGSLQQQTNRWLATAIQDGTYATLSQKYFGRLTGP